MAETLRTFLGLSIHWAILTVVIAVATGWLVMRGVQLSTFWSGVFFLFRGRAPGFGQHSHARQASPFSDACSLQSFKLAGGLAGLGTGFPLAVYLFIGWENSASLAEETENPRRNIACVNYRHSSDWNFLYLSRVCDRRRIPNGRTRPWRLAAPVHRGPQGIRARPVDCCVHRRCHQYPGLVDRPVNSQARILFNSGREGLLPEFLGKIHPRHQTPSGRCGYFSSLRLC